MQTDVQLPLGLKMSACAATEPGRYAMSTVAVTRVTATQVELASTDGRMLAVARLPCEPDCKLLEGRPTLIPGDRWTLAERAAGARKPLAISFDSEPDVAFGAFIDAKNRADSSGIVAQPIEGQFPRYQEIMPQPDKSDTVVHLNAKLLRQALGTLQGVGDGVVELRISSPTAPFRFKSISADVFVYIMPVTIR